MKFGIVREESYSLDFVKVLQSLCSKKILNFIKKITYSIRRG